MDIWSKLKTINTPIVLYGTGNGADKVISRLNNLNIPIAGIFASNGFIRNRSFHGLPVESFDALYQRHPDMTVLMCFGTSRPEVINNVKQIAEKVPLYIPEVPVYGDTVFDDTFYCAHKTELQTVRSYLADDLSKYTFDSIIEYKLHGTPESLYNCQTDEQELYSLIHLPTHPTLMDLGAYNGDTAVLLTRFFPNYKQLIAVEPDLHSYNKLMQNTAHLNNIQYINALIGNENTTAFLEKAKGRGAHQQNDKGIPTKVLTIDFIADNRQIDFIKMDIEGNESAGLHGAKQTIMRNKPTLKIACYHRSEDLFELPLYLLSLNPNYRFYLRHASSLPAWDTEFLAFDYKQTR